MPSDLKPGPSFFSRIKTAFCKTVKPAFSTIRFLLVLMIPLSFVVLALEVSGVLYYIARFMGPVMRLVFALPGEAALVVISSVFLNIYSAIAVIHSLNLSTREITILATICCIAHNFFVECMVMKKTGSSLTKMVFLRLGCAVIAGFLMRLLLPASFGNSGDTAGGTDGAGVLPALPPPALGLGGLGAALVPWLRETCLFVLKVSGMVFGVMFLQKVLEELGIMRRLGALTAPFMSLMGLSSNMGYLWFVANIAGVAYGAAVLIEETRAGTVSESEADLFNHHAAISHSQLEDTLLFMNIGVPYAWVALPRFFVAVAVAWLERGRRALFRRSFRVKVESVNRR